MKHLVSSRETSGQFSFHLVRVAPGKRIGQHVHETQLETHEVISGGGVCRLEQAKLRYEPWTISILLQGTSHEVLAGAEGVCLFAKFFPALI